MFTSPWEVLEISLFCIISTQGGHTSSLSPNLSFPLIHPNHPLAGKKENKRAKKVEKIYFNSLVLRVFFKASRRQRASPGQVVGCDAKAAELARIITPNLISKSGFIFKQYWDQQLKSGTLLVSKGLFL